MFVLIIKTQFQFLHKLLPVSLSLQNPLLVLKHRGSYPQRTPGMETSQGLCYSTKEKDLQGHQPS